MLAAALSNHCLHSGTSAFWRHANQVMQDHEANVPASDDSNSKSTNHAVDLKRGKLFHCIGCMREKMMTS